MKRLRLLKVVLTPIFVVDDGVNLEEINFGQKVINSKNWDEFSQGAFSSGNIKKLECELWPELAKEETKEETKTD